MIEYKDGRPVHFPAKPDRFEFDAEVASIFPDMAKRAIPLYEEAHEIHAALLCQRIMHDRRKYVIADVGASTGKFIERVCNQLQSVHGVTPEDWVTFFAIDTSEAMLERIRSRFSPDLVCTTTVPAQRMAELNIKFDAINMAYVLQFIPPSEKTMALCSILSTLRDNGMFIFSHKETVQGDFANGFNELYMDLRRRNGYTEEEIKAKTEALKNSMWTSPEYILRMLLESFNIASVTPTIRYLSFCSYIGVKNNDG